MPALPVNLNLAQHRCLIVGGGAVARRRAAALLEAGAQVVIVAPQVVEDLASLPVTIHRRAYQTGDADGAFLVIAATDVAAVNEQVASDARLAGALVNRADDRGTCDVTFPATARKGPITIAVDSGSSLPDAAATMRDELAAALDPTWPCVVPLAAAARRRMVESIADPAERRRRIAALISREARAMYSNKGEAAYRDYCASLLP